MYVSSKGAKESFHCIVRARDLHLYGEIEGKQSFEYLKTISLTIVNVSHFLVNVSDLIKLTVSLIFLYPSGS